MTLRLSAILFTGLVAFWTPDAAGQALSAQGNTGSPEHQRLSQKIIQLEAELGAIRRDMSVVLRIVGGSCGGANSFIKAVGADGNIVCGTVSFPGGSSSMAQSGGSIGAQSAGSSQSAAYGAGEAAAQAAAEKRPEADACTASPEVCAAYSTALNRMPEKWGAMFWEDKAQEMRASGMTSAQVTAAMVAQMANSNEARQNRGETVDANERAHEIAVHTNSANAAGIKDAGTSCNGGANCGGTASAALSQGALGDIYQSALGRAPDPEGAAFWSNKIATGAMTVDQVRHAIENSPEALGR